MTEEIKKAMNLAEKEIQDKRIESLKNVIKAILETIAEKTKARNEIDEDIRLLKKDVDDFKAGRLDKIEERQQKDKRAAEVSIVKVHKVVEHVRHHYDISPWYVPYRIDYTVGDFPEHYGQFCTNNAGFVMTSSDAKFNTTGTYALSSGVIVHL